VAIQQRATIAHAKKASLAYTSVFPHQEGVHLLGAPLKFRLGNPLASRAAEVA